jgi:hypothetical protein
MDRLVGGKGITRCTQTVLVRHDYEPETSALQLSERRKYPRHEADFIDRIDLFIDWFLDEGSVAVNERDPCATHRRASSNRSF